MPSSLPSRRLQAAYQLAYDKFPFGPTRCELRRNCSTFGSQYTTPYSFQLSAGMQRELRTGLMLSVDYVRHRGVHFLLQIDQNRVGAADNLNVPNALAAMNAVSPRTWMPARACRVDCAIASPVAPRVTIATYAAQRPGQRIQRHARASKYFCFLRRQSKFQPHEPVQHERDVHLQRAAGATPRTSAQP